MRRIGLCLLWMSISVAAFGCPNSADSPANSSCDEVGKHFLDCAGQIEAEKARIQCIAFEWPASTRACAMRVKACDEMAIDACGLTEIVLVCDTNADCPKPLVCGTSSECVGCSTDADCAEGKGCLFEVCIDKSVPGYDQVKRLDAHDAGA